MYVGPVCGLQVRIAVKNSTGMVKVEVIQYTWLAVAGCGLRLFSVRDRILPQAT